jgi:predicted ester cyclase
VTDRELQSHVEENKAVIRRFVEEVQNRRDWDVYDELNDPSFVNHSSPPGVPNDREGGKAFLGGFLNAFPDAKFTIDDMIAEGEQVVTKKTFTGTHKADFFGIPATWNPVTLQFVDIMRVREGRITEHWLSMDQLSFMQQLGVIPEPGTAQRTRAAQAHEFSTRSRSQAPWE